MTQLSAISQQIWDMKYRLKNANGQPIDKGIEDTWRRVAKSLASVEQDPVYWEKCFYELLENFKFLPAGRILSGAGTNREVTLFNCFVMGTIPDNMVGIFESLKEAAVTMQQGGGIGYDFSSLRPKGAPVIGVGADASGPLSFMDVWDSMCRTIMSAGSRRGAMMATLRCDHPDIENFIEAKSEPGRLCMFNLSVLITDEFMHAVKEGAAWELKFNGTSYRSISARALWKKIMQATYSYAEPGVIFIDRINHFNNLSYCETIQATNPCGEQPLPPYGACLLGSLNLAQLVKFPFAKEATLDTQLLERLVGTAVRLMDNTIDVSGFPLKKQEEEAKSKRRIGLGITGLANALIMCNVRYGSERSIKLVESWMKVIQRAAYSASINLAREKGSFPNLNKNAFLTGETVKTLDKDIREGIYQYGIRNALLTSIAPTGTISLLADNVSSGLEPVFSFSYKRRILMEDGSTCDEDISDYAYRQYKNIFGDKNTLPDTFVTAQSLTPNDHLKMQAIIQKYVDSSISKTINVPENISFENFEKIYQQAYDLGCKGCSTYRPNEITGAILIDSEADNDAEPQLPLEGPLSGNIPDNNTESGAVVYMTKPLDRPGELQGKTYKVRWPDSEHAIYITLNDVIDDSGRIRPFEIFINTKNTEHFAWTVALTRMISAVFRRGGDVTFVVEELKAVFDPRGGQWVGGKYVPSLLAEIGRVIETHMINTGFLKTSNSKTNYFVDEKQSVNSGIMRGTSSGKNSCVPFRQCPKCAQQSLSRQEGCDTCIGCGYSKCG